MRIRVLGGGWYGSHIAASLIDEGHDVELHEIAGSLFAGASGGNPARCHLGFHYPRSRETRSACQLHQFEFMHVYGHLTKAVPVNIYAVAQDDSLVDYGTYAQVLKGEVEFVTIRGPGEFGLKNVQGAMLTGERHVIIAAARRHFEEKLAGRIHFGQPIGDPQDDSWDVTIDCTFCALDAERIDRYEPCVTALLSGPTDRAVTIMDGPFPSIYPWNEDEGLSSLTSAKFTPLSKTCRSYGEANEMLSRVSAAEANARAELMLHQMADFWPDAWDRYSIADTKLSIRAMPKSASDARLADVARVGDRVLRVRAGKIDAIFHAHRLVQALLPTFDREAAQCL